MSELLFRPWSKTLPRRTFLLLVIAGSLLVIGFYTVSDTARLAGSHVLDGADYIGYAVCHRITDHSLSVGGRQLPLCARCTGMYLGVTLTFVVLALAGRRRWADLPPLKVLLVLLIFVALMGVDGINSYSHFFPNAPHLYEPKNWLRLITGMGTGLTMGSVMFPALAQTLWRDQQRRSALVDFRELAGLVVLAGFAVALVLSNQPTILYVLSLASAAGVVIILAAINCMLLLIGLRRDARASNWRQAAPPLIAGLMLALVQIGVVSYLRFSLTGTLTGFPGLP